MDYIETVLSGIWILKPKVFDDSRGYFMETYKQTDFEKHIASVPFTQDNESCSVRGVLRGLHYQLAPCSQAKLVRVIRGTVLDAVVDIRRHSPTFGKSFTVELSGENKLQLFISKGFAHGFHVLSETVVFTYKVDRPYVPACERGIRFDDPAIGIDWKLTEREAPILSEKDRQLPLLKDAELNFEYNGGIE
ncbi:MAG: dTDP-4-dehydrorhamnose 3,5-epimerase [Tannerella sp.]|jgi:dTDP-4-dehydrorhamnose 3,5-epimerase|nr:dTDP-4-dehydrorhamnose 3,5-epimerase [Tannerella sp.]